MRDTVNKVAHLVGAGRRGRWVGITLLAVVVSGFEAAGAILVFGLIELVTGADEAITLPIIGEMNRWLPGDTRAEVFRYAAVVVTLFFILRGGLLLTKAYLEARAAENAGATLSARLLRGYLNAPYSVHIQRNSAELIRNTYDSVQAFVMDVLTPAVKLVSESLIVFGMVLVLVATNVTATVLALLILGPMVIFLLRVLHPRVQALGVTSQELSRSSLQSLQQSLGAWRDIKVLGREQFFEQGFADERFRLARARYLRSAAREVPRVAIETGVILLIVGFLAYTMARAGTFTGALPVLGLFGYAALRLQPTLNKIFVALNHLRFADAVVDDLHRDLTAADQFANSRGETGPVLPLPLREELRLEGVSYCYEGSEVPAIKDVDLTIRRGEAIAIVGSSGGGKSTLVDIILGLLEPTAGKILVDGVDLRYHTAAWHQNIGMVSQDVYLVDDTLRRNVALGVEDGAIDEERVVTAIREAQLDDFVESLPEGMDTFVGDRGVRFSGGQRQRVAIARALYRRPPVLVLDEGTAALDSVTEADLIRALQESDKMRTLIIVTHRTSTVRFCDQIAVVDGGEIVALGRFDDLEQSSSTFKALLQGGTDDAH